MLPRFQPPCRFLPASLALLMVSQAGAQLAKNSPFLPPQAPAAVAGPTAGAPLEWRGYIDLPGEGPKVRIYDPNRKIGAWLKINQRDPGFDAVVKQYDATRDTVSVEYRGQTLVLAQREAKVTSSGAIQQPMPVAVNMPMPAAVTNAVALNPTPAQEQQRLEAVAAEVARRRQLREQASDPNNPVVGAAPAPQVIQPQVQQRQPPANTAQNPNNAQRGQRAGGAGRGGRGP